MNFVSALNVCMKIGDNIVLLRYILQTVLIPVKYTTKSIKSIEHFQRSATINTVK